MRRRIWPRRCSIGEERGSRILALVHLGAAHCGAAHMRAVAANALDALAKG